VSGCLNLARSVFAKISVGMKPSSRQPPSYLTLRQRSVFTNQRVVMVLMQQMLGVACFFIVILRYCLIKPLGFSVVPQIK
jgi:hypothetical protein